MKRIPKITAAALLPLCALIFTLVGMAESRLPDVFQNTESSDCFVLFHGAVTASATTGEKSQTVAAAGNDLEEWETRLFGVIPIKTVTVKNTDAPVVRLCGVPFGIKAYTDGVLVVGLCDVDEHGKNVSPAKEAGIRVGDVILSVEGMTVTTNEEIAAVISNGAGKPQAFRVRRDDVEFTAKVRAAYSASDGTYKAGMWVRDSAAGIGTLTFYDEQSGMLAGLGHAICDVDTGEALPISGGELVPAYIFDVNKGEKGKAGELRGSFVGGSFGELYKNAETGIYGLCSSPPTDGEWLTVAMKQQVKEGKAKIYACVEKDAPAWYDVEVEKVRYNEKALTRNMVVKITDERLLQKTGGIVKGMSGSPIVQDGRLIGAVTHVFVDDPTEGYAIFAENMWKTAVAVAENADDAA